MKNKQSCFRQGCMWLIMAGLAGLLIMLAGFAILSQWPILGAQGSDFLRALVGDQAVSALETGYYQINDILQSWEYGSGLEKPAAPWAEPTKIVETVTPPIVPTPENRVQQAEPQPPAVPTWKLESVKSLGSLKGEGIWSPYILNAAGEAVAFRTYLQPDPERPYAIVAVMAFDVSHTRLHYVLGSIEPYAPGAPARSGAMPKADMADGVLLAMFNFGAMADSVVAIPARDGLGTLAIYPDGRLGLGAWGTDINPSEDMLAWRQNGPLAVRNGEINPEINNNSPQDWGYTIGAVSPTWRSGVGLSADGRTLYYFCGPSLSMEALAKSMQAAGANNAIQLDINTFWVHFVAVHSDGTIEALFPNMMKENLGRYLYPYTRDFFYVTATP
jgi:uncharacterized membrane protein